VSREFSLATHAPLLTGCRTANAEACVEKSAPRRRRLVVGFLPFLQAPPMAPKGIGPAWAPTETHVFVGQRSALLEPAGPNAWRSRGESKEASRPKGPSEPHGRRLSFLSAVPDQIRQRPEFTPSPAEGWRCPVLQRSRCKPCPAPLLTTPLPALLPIIYLARSMKWWKNKPTTPSGQDKSGQTFLGFTRN